MSVPAAQRGPAGGVACFAAGLVDAEAEDGNSIGRAGGGLGGSGDGGIGGINGAAGFRFR